MSADRTDLSNLLYSKKLEILSEDLQELTRLDKRFKIDAEYIEESSKNIDASNDLIIRSKNNNIYIVTDPSKSIHLYGDTIVHDNLSINTVIMKNTSVFDTNVDISNQLSVYGYTILKSNVDMSSNLTVGGDVSINSNLEVIKNLIVYSDASFLSNIDISGVLNVDSNTYLNSNLDISNNLNVNGDVSLNSNVDIIKHLNVFNDVSLNSNVDISKHLSVNSDVSLNANVDITKNLTVNGNVSLNSSVDISGNLKINKLIVDGDVSLNSNLDISNHLNVNGDVSLNSSIDVENKLIVNGDVSLNSNLDISNNLNVKGTTLLSNTLTVDNNTTISSSLNTGATDISDTLIVDGNVSLNSNIDISNHLTVNGDVSLNSNVDISNNLNVKGTTKISNTLTVENNTILSTSLNTGATDISDTLVVNGDVSLNSNIDISNHLTVNGDVSMNSNVDISNNLNVYGTSTFTDFQSTKMKLIDDKIAIGNTTAINGQEPFAIAIGNEAANNSEQKTGAIAIGNKAGYSSQKMSAIALGNEAGQNIQDMSAIAIGTQAGYTSQRMSAIAIGTSSGHNDQKENSIAIGKEAGQTDQSSNSIAVGYKAGNYRQGNYSIAIGYGAGQTNQKDRTIALNASDISFVVDSSNAFYVNPIRDILNTSIMQYNTVSKEITYNSDISTVGSITCGDINCANIYTLGNNINMELGDIICDTITLQTLTVKQDASFNSNVDISNYLTVGGDVSFNSNVVINGNLSMLTGNLNMNELTVNNITVIEDVSMNSDVDISNILNVAGNTFLNYLVVSKDVSLNSKVDISNHLMVIGDVSLNSNVDIVKHLNVEGDISLNSIVDISSNLNVGGEVLLKSDTIISKHLTVDGDVSLNSNIDISGALNITNLTIGGALSLKSNVDISDHLNVNGDVSLNSSVDIEKHLDVNGDVSLNSSVDIEKHLDVNGDVSLNSNVDISNNLTVKGDISIIGHISALADASFGDVDISNANINIGVGKTLDISNGNLILKNNQISGDAIEGGTISNITISNLTGPIDISNNLMENVNISGGNIKVNSINCGDISVNIGKTIDFSGATLILNEDQISGDSISGGTIDSIIINKLGGPIDFQGYQMENVDISGGTLHGVSVTPGDVIIMPGYTLDASAGQILLKDNQISGDKINGGTIDTITISEIAGPMDCSNQEMKNVNISGGIINNVSINSNYITIDTGKTLDISAGSLLLRDDQISGDKVEGGTISSITISEIAGAMDCSNQDMTNVNITSGSITGISLSPGDMTVAAGKTLDLSAGTLLLRDDQISGDKIEGGTIDSITINNIANPINFNNNTMTNVNITSGAITGANLTGSLGVSQLTGAMNCNSQIMSNVNIQGGVINNISVLTATFSQLGILSDLDVCGNINFSGNIIPTEDEVYNIGAPNKKIKDFYLSSGTLFMGEVGEAPVSVLKMSGGQAEFTGVVVPPPTPSQTKFDSMEVSGNIHFKNKEKTFKAEGDVSFNKNLDISENLLVKGEGRFTGTGNSLVVENDTSLNKNLNVGGVLTVNNGGGKGLVVENDTSLNKNLYLGGTLYAPSTFYIDPMMDNDVSGIVVIKGDLQVEGTRTIVNSSIVEISDHTLFLGSNASNISQVDGAGLEISGNKKFTYSNSINAWKSNIGLNIDGNLGIGVASPSAKLEVDGDISINGNVKFTGALQMDNNSIMYNISPGAAPYINTRFLQNISTISQDGMYINYNSSGSTAADLRFYANGSNQRMIIKANSGNIGIGTENPDGHLHVSSGADGDCIFILESDILGNNPIDNPKIIFKQNGGEEQAAIEKSSNNLNIQNTLGNIIFSTSNSNSNYKNTVSRMVITASGDVIIGGILELESDVSGISHISMGRNTNTTSYFGNAAIGYTPDLSLVATFAHANNNSKTEYAIAAHDDGELFLNAATDKYIKFRINNEDKMILDGSGNLGIGTITPKSKLDVSGNLIVNGDASFNKNVDICGSLTVSNVIIGSANINELELEIIDSVNAGTVSSSKAVVVDSNKDITGFRNITSSGVLDVGNSDLKHLIGKAAIGYIGNSGQMAGFAHRDHATDTNFAFKQGSLGSIVINCPINKTHTYSVNNVKVMDLSHGGIDVSGTIKAYSLTVDNTLSAGYDKNITSYLGNAALGYNGYNGWATFAHINNNDATSYALGQKSNGRTILNANSGEYISFRINDDGLNDYARYDITGFGIGKIPTRKLDVSGNVNIDGDISLNSNVDISNNLIVNNTITAAYNENKTSYIGRLAIGYNGHGGNWGGIANINTNTASGFALTQNASGKTILNAESGQNISFSIGNSNSSIYNTTGLGIGKTPTKKLDVLGNVNIDGDISLNSNVDISGSLKISNAYTLPTLDGSSGYILTTDGSGVVSWEDVSGGGSSNANLTNYSDASFGITDISGLLTVNNNITSSGTISMSKDTDSTSYFGRAAIGHTSSLGDAATFKHVDFTASTDYALSQYSSGRTYLNAPAGQEIKFRIANSNKMTLDSNGQLGIGTGGPSALLDVNGSMRAGYDSDTTSYFGRTGLGYTGWPDWAGFAHIDNIGSNTGDYCLIQNSAGISLLNASSSQFIGFRINNVDKMRLTSSGDIGIGTIAPSEKLHIYGSGNLYNLLQTTGGNAFYKSKTATGEYGTGTNGDSFAIYSYDDSAYRLWIDDTGLVGLGTTSPQEKLHVYGSSTTRIEVESASTHAYFKCQSSSRAYGVGTSGTDWKLYDYDAATSRICMSSSGLVGIGTDSPAGLLHLSSSSGDTKLIIEADTGNNNESDNPIIIFKQDGGEESSAIGHINTNELQISNGISSGGIVFNTTTTSGYTNATQRMKITNTGNVGIGTSSPSGMLHISSGTSGDCILILEADTDNNNETDNPMIIFKQDGNNEMTFIGKNDNALEIKNSAGGGDEPIISFSTGTSNNSYSSATERMRITGDGLIGIGLTNPTKLFEVAGDISAATYYGNNLTVNNLTSSRIRVEDSTTKKIAIGELAGTTNQSINSTALGYKAGTTNQGAQSIAIGHSAAYQDQGINAISIGYEAGAGVQGQNTIAIGYGSGWARQASYAISIGSTAGMLDQSFNAVAIGYEAGYINQRVNSIAIGYRAGYSNQSENSITLNATGALYSVSNPNSFYVAPIRNAISNSVLLYNSTTKEITESVEMKTLIDHYTTSRNLTIVGGNNTTSDASFTIAYSLDGLDYIGVKDSSNIFYNVKDIVYDSSKNIWIAVGEGVNYSIAYSYDGITWKGVEQSKGTNISTRGRAVKTNSNRILAVGEGTKEVAYSDDGINWTYVDLGSGTNTQIDTIWHSLTSRWYITGVDSDGGSPYHHIRYSTDGISWTNLNVAGSVTGYGYGQCLGTNGVRIVNGCLNGNYGQGIDFHHMIYSDDNGSTWNNCQTNASQTTGPHLFSLYANKIVYENGVWMAAGAENPSNPVGFSLAHSKDGIVWTGVVNSKNIFTSATDVRWNGIRWVATGTGLYSIAYSDDNGITWNGITDSSLNIIGAGEGLGTSNNNNKNTFATNSSLENILVSNKDVSFNIGTFTNLDISSGTSGNGLIVQGNVGIGITTPTSSLHVAGNASFNSIVDISSLTVNGNVSLNSNVDISNHLTVNRDVSLNSNVDISGSLKISNAYTLPIIDGTNGYVLKTNGSGVVSWSDVSSSGTANLTNYSDASFTNIDISGVLKGKDSNNQIALGSHIIPTSNALYDFGSAEYKVRHLFLSDNSLWIGDDHKVDISGGKMKFKKRKRNQVPRTITDGGGHAEGAKTHAGVGSLEEMTLQKWINYGNFIEMKGPNTRVDINDIYTHDTTNWDRDDGAADVTTGSDVSFAKTDISGILTVKNDLYLEGKLYTPSIFYIDPAIHNDNSGTVIIRGNLQVDGEKTIVNSTIVEISDHTIFLASNASNTSQTNGAGLEISGNKKFTYVDTNDSWESNIGLTVNGDVSLNSNIDISGSLKVSNAYTLPTTDGTNGDVLKTNGSGILSWGNSSSTNYILKLTNTSEWDDANDGSHTSSNYGIMNGTSINSTSNIKVFNYWDVNASGNNTPGCAINFNVNWNPSTYVSSNRYIRFPETGVYRITCNFYIYNNNIQRASPAARILSTIGGTSRWLGAPCATGYIRKEDGHYSSSLNFNDIINITTSGTSGDYIQIYFERHGRSGTGNTEIGPGCAQIILERIS